MSDIVERLEEQANTAFTFNITRRDVAEAAAEIKRLREALELIAGDRPCLDNLMGNVDVARAALAKLKGEGDD